MGTSELCLAIAGYHPETFDADSDVYDYWMFEGLRASNNRELHVTSTHCDDPAARALAGGSRNALTLHGCTAAQAGAPSTEPQAVVVGGLNETFKAHLMNRFRAAGFYVLDGSDNPALAGVHPDNIANRTLLGAGAQLELTTELRAAMFEVNTRAGRRKSTTGVFWAFVWAARDAIQLLEQQQ
ncbi:poly-gamma-glutamate hydrolase family protein [Streptomyces gobiensis]|uniref:poly-gamma-glutamate hydrolase family protein n=1 Tax=Streptomyces gobiensis TaxID=2875706 RepID=UPI001E453FED|nr:poly-gamma-glutamate hydrolase family protein [Streptomyces gobiensis]UGY94229.1 poly-gamma-glutamate hydrolase family protein [Streptomyces gobiensis]